MYTLGLATDQHCVLPALVTLVSIADALSAGDRHDISLRVITTGVGSSEIDTMRRVSRRLGFGSFGCLDVPRPREFSIVHGTYITTATYLRLLFRRPYVDTDHFLYLDCDVFVVGDIAEPFEALDDTRPIAAVRDEINHTVGQGPALPGLTSIRPDLSGHAYFNAGALWARADALTRLSKGVQSALRCRQHIHFNDQDGLNLWFLSQPVVRSAPAKNNRFELGRLREDSDWIQRVLGPAQSLGDASAIHFIGPAKPWYKDCPQVEAVRTYRKTLHEARRQVARVGDATLSCPSGSAR